MFPLVFYTSIHSLWTVWFVEIYWLYVVLANDVILCGALLDSWLDSLYRVAIVPLYVKDQSVRCRANLIVYPIGPHIKCFCLFWFHGAMDD